MTTHPDLAVQAAIADAQQAARVLRGRLVTARAAGDRDEPLRVLGAALAASAVLVDAVPGLAVRHSLWVDRFASTSAYMPARRAPAAINHLHQLAHAASKPVIVTDPGTRFAGTLDEVVVRR